MPVILETGATIYYALDIIRRAYQILGDIEPGEALTADQADIGLHAFNTLLDGLSIERLMIYQVKQEELTWTALSPSRTIGPAGDFNTRRPDRIEDGTYFKDSNNIAYPVSVERNREVYDGIYDKTVQSSYPNMLFYDPGFPLGTLYVYPVPNQNLTLLLNTWQTLTQVNTINDQFIFPPGYRRLLEFNLAKELESEVGLPLPAKAEKIAYDSLRDVKRHNNVPTVAQTETAYILHGRGRSDIVAGK